MLIIYRLLKPKFVEFVDWLPGIFLSMEVFFLLLNILFIVSFILSVILAYIAGIVLKHCR